MSKRNTREDILNCAEKLLQERGYHGWSYQDIACKVGIRKASIHYHFPFKENLGCALVVAYQTKLHNALSDIEAVEANPQRRLQEMISLIAQVVEEPNLYCLCGMLASDFTTLDPKMQEEVRKAFKLMQNWICKILLQGESEGYWQCPSGCQRTAQTLLACLEGMLLLCRLEKGQKDFLAMTKVCVESLLVCKSV